jgi:hypothetical protein
VVATTGVVVSTIGVDTDVVFVVAGSIVVDEDCGTAFVVVDATSVVVAVVPTIGFGKISSTSFPLIGSPQLSNDSLPQLRTALLL